MKVAWITGASSGIGASLAREFVARGYFVACLARRLDRLEALVGECHRDGGHALAIQADVTSPDSLRQAVEKTLARWGRIDVVVANAGFGVVGEVENLSVDDFERQFTTNVTGVLHTLYATLPVLKKSHGHFGIVSSVLGHLALPGNAPYAMSKFAVRALAESLRPELARSGVAVTLISPGLVDSEIRRVDNQGKLLTTAKDPIPKWLRMPSNKAARVIARAILRRRAEVVVTLHGKVVVFLASHFPNLVRFLIGHLNIRSRREAH